MIEIKIPKEISDYKQKFLFGLTVRQFISVAVALGICVPTYIFGKEAVGEDIISWVIIVIAAPIFCFGFLKFNGMPFEQFAKTVIRQYIEPQKRTYVDLPVFWFLRREMIEDELLHQAERKNPARKAAPSSAKKWRDRNGNRVEDYLSDLRQEMIEEELLHQAELKKRSVRETALKSKKGRDENGERKGTRQNKDS